MPEYRADEVHIFDYCRVADHASGFYTRSYLALVDVPLDVGGMNVSQKTIRKLQFSEIFEPKKLLPLSSLRRRDFLLENIDCLRKRQAGCCTETFILQKP